jgi:hypothetical protein
VLKKLYIRWPSAPLHTLNSCFQFKERYLLLMGNLGPENPSQHAKKAKISRLLRELSDTEDEDSFAGPTAEADPQQPWIQDFHAYLDSRDTKAEDVSIVAWWGVSTFLYRDSREINHVTVQCPPTLRLGIPGKGLPANHGCIGLERACLFPRWYHH